MLHADVLAERARLDPGRLAVVDATSGARLSYGECDRRVDACAGAWRQALGLKPGDRVALLSGNRLEFLDAFLAAARSGVVLVPLGTRLTAAELAYIINDCSPRVLVYDAEHATLVPRLAPLVSVSCWVALDSPAAGDHLAHADLVAGRTWPPFSGARPGPDDPLCLLYTSGTTGRPKGVVVPHRMVAWNGYNTAISWQLRDTDVTPVFTPLYHAGGLGAFLMPILTVGGTIVLHRGFDVHQVWTTIERERCTVALGVPTIFQMLADAPEFSTLDLRHVRWFISGGAPLPVHLVTVYQARGVVLKQGYGLTEVGVNCFAMSVEDAVRKAGSVGRPLMFTEARLADENGAEVGEGGVGELLLRGPHVCRGYWNNPAATSEAIDALGWFHTGDSRAPRRRGLLLHRGPEEGHVHLGRRERLSGGDRERAAAARRGRRRRGRGRPARHLGRGRRRLRRPTTGAIARTRGAGYLPRGPTGPVQDPEGVRVGRVASENPVR